MRMRTGAVLAALALAGCGGGDDDEGLGKAALAKAADKICADYTQRGKDLGQPDLTDPAQAEDYFNKARDLTQEQQDELDALEPAEGVKKEYDAFLASSAKATKLLGDLAAAAKAKDQDKGVELANQLPSLSTEVNEAAEAVGAEACAS